MRKSIVFGLLVALAALGVGLYLKRSARPAEAQAVTLDRSLVALLPANATSLVGVDVERLKGTPLYRHFEEESRRGDPSRRNHFDEFAAQTGFDPRRDVQELLIASWVEQTLSGPASQFVAVARGQFNVARLSGELRGKATVENYRGVEVFGPGERPPSRPGRSRGPAPRRGEEQGRFAFLDEKTALAGPRPAVLAAIDRKLGGGPSLLANTALLSRAQTISGTNQVWAVSDSPAPIVARALPKDDAAQSSNFARIFSSMRNSTFALDLMNGLDLQAAGVCPTAQDARTLADAVRGLVAFGRLSASQKDPGLMAVFDSIQVEQRNAELNFSVRMDVQTFEKFLEKSGERRRPKRAEAAGGE